jgi:SAM-dependent methyltransferase
MAGTAEVDHRPDDYALEQACAADDTRFYGHVLRRLHPVRVLELACGSGRVLASLTSALPTAELVGVDAAPDMLTRAERRLAALAPAARERVTLIEGDMRRWTGHGAPFDAVLIGCCSVSHLLTLEDRRRTWIGVFDCLKPGGHFLMDVKMPDLATLAEAQRIAPRALVQLDVDAARRSAAGAAGLLRCTATMYADAACRRALPLRQVRRRGRPGPLGQRLSEPRLLSERTRAAVRQHRLRSGAAIRRLRLRALRTGLALPHHPGPPPRSVTPR